MPKIDGTNTDGKHRRKITLTLPKPVKGLVLTTLTFNNIDNNFIVNVRGYSSSLARKQIEQEIKTTNTLYNVKTHFLGRLTITVPICMIS